MPYTTVQPPFTLEFDHMSRQELDAYATWFHGAIARRINELTAAVRETPGFGGWRPDYTPASLDHLGKWFAGQVEVRPRTREESDEILGQQPIPVGVPDQELTNRTFSLAMDIGMYLSEVLMRNVSGLRWEQPLRDKHFADYGQPVIVGAGTVPFNPVAITVTLAYGIVRQTKGAYRLRELYDIWSKLLRAV